MCRMRLYVPIRHRPRDTHGGPHAHAQTPLSPHPRAARRGARRGCGRSGRRRQDACRAGGSGRRDVALVQLRPRRQERHGRRLGPHGLQQRLVGQQLRLPAGGPRRRHTQQVRQAVHVGRRARGRHQRAPARRPLRHGDRPGQERARRRPVREEGLRRRDLGPHPAAVHDRAAGDHPARPDGADRVHLRRGRQLRGRRPEPGLALRAARRPPLGRPAGARQRVPRPPEHGDRPPDQPERHGQLPRLGRPPVLRPEHRALQPLRRPVRRRVGLRRPHRPADATTTPTVCGARSTRSLRRSVSRRR